MLLEIFILTLAFSSIHSKLSVFPTEKSPVNPPKTEVHTLTINTDHSLTPQLLSEATKLHTVTPNTNTKAQTTPTPPSTTHSPTPTASPDYTPLPPSTTIPLPSIPSTHSPQPTLSPLPTQSVQSSTPTRATQPTGPQMDALFTKYAQQYNIDREQLRKIAICESKLNTNALNKTYDYGGLYQFSPSSWKAYRKVMGLDTDIQLRFSAEEAIKTAAWMLSTGRANAWPSCK